MIATYVELSYKIWSGTYMSAVLVQLCVDSFNNLQESRQRQRFVQARWCVRLEIPTRLFKARSGPGNVFAVARRICSSRPLPRS